MGHEEEEDEVELGIEELEFIESVKQMSLQSQQAVMQLELGQSLPRAGWVAPSRPLKEMARKLQDKVANGGNLSKDDMKRLVEIGILDCLMSHRPAVRMQATAKLGTACGMFGGPVKRERTPKEEAAERLRALGRNNGKRT